MSFNFQLEKTEVNRNLKFSSFPLFSHADILAQLFFYLFIVSLFLFLFASLGIVSETAAVKIPIFIFTLFLLSLEVYLFSELKIKNPSPRLLLSDTISNPQNYNYEGGRDVKTDFHMPTERGNYIEENIPPYNLADFLSLESAKIIKRAIKIAKKKKLYEISSEILFYSSLLESREIQTLTFRLGMDAKKLQEDLKNYLEKSRIQNPENIGKTSLIFSESFQQIIVESAKMAHERGHMLIGEKEIFANLAKYDLFFKDVLIENELKEKDVESITLWLDDLEEKLKDSKKFWTKKNLSKLGSFGRDFAAGFTVTLDQFSIDWREIEKNNIFNEITGHQKEIDGLEIILTKSKLSNALIIGEKGVGKKSLVQALAQRCFLGTGLVELKDKRVVELDMVSLISRIQDQEKLEITLDQIFQETLASGNVILVIDDLDKFVTLKTQKPGEIDISVVLAKYLAIPAFDFIGITTYEGLHRKLEEVPSFMEYFSKIEVSEISESETINILQNLSAALEYKYNILIIYPAIREIINLTSRYFPSTPFPKKAIDTLDEAAAYVNSKKEKVLFPHHIAKIISDKTQIPVGKLEIKEKSVLMNLENLIHQKIVNQENAVNEISIAMRRARAGIASKKRPMGVFLFLGPTGVGKTETAKALADIYFNGQEKMIRLDMSEFQDISDIPRLIGAVSPVEQHGLLTTSVRENPFALVLLDEIEKSHPNILNLFLQVFDEGHITDGQGRKIIFTNTIIICTSNAGAPMIFKSVESGKMIEKDKLLSSLFDKGIFKPEFINRFDATVIFHPLTKDNLNKIAQIMLSGLQKNLKEKDIDLIITDPLKEKIVELSYKPEFGAREMRRVVQDKVENEVAKALLSDKITGGDKIEINPDNFEVIKIE